MGQDFEAIFPNVHLTRKIYLKKINLWKINVVSIYIYMSICKKFLSFPSEHK